MTDVAINEERQEEQQPEQLPVQTSPPKRRRSTLKRREHWMAMLFISIKYFGLIVFTLIPLIFALLYSFSNYIGTFETEPFITRIDNLWCWFDNYAKLFGSSTYGKMFLNAVLNNLIFMLSVPLGIFVGLVIAVILSKEDAIRGSRVFRLLIYVPVVSSAVAMNIIWRYIFDNQFGIINGILGVKIPWLTDNTWIKIAIILKSAWGALGHTMILCLAALTNASKDYYEAAELDGANEIVKFFHISIPLISPTIFYLFTTGFISNLEAYTDAQVFAEGLPGAQTVVYYIWFYGIQRSRYGIASAASIVLTIAIMIITMVQFKLQNKWVYSE